MTYFDFKTLIQRHLNKHPSGATWRELRDTLKLPYDRPCPEWTKRLEKEIGLLRLKGQGRGLRWALPLHAAERQRGAGGSATALPGNV